MKKLTRVLAASLVSLFALGVYAAPATAAEADDTLEEIMCSAVDPQIDALAEVVDDGETEVTALAQDVNAARTALRASSETLGTTGLAWVQAVDGEADEDAALDEFADAVTDFSNEVVDWIEAVDNHAVANEELGLNEAVLIYLEELCPPAG